MIKVYMDDGDEVFPSMLTYADIFDNDWDFAVQTAKTLHEKYPEREIHIIYKE